MGARPTNNLERPKRRLVWGNRAVGLYLNRDEGWVKRAVRDLGLPRTVLGRGSVAYDLDEVDRWLASFREGDR